MSDASEYGLWRLVVINSLIVLFLVFRFFRPQTRRDWRTFGVFSAFVVALFTEKLFGDQYAPYAESIPRFIPRIPWRTAFQRLR